MALRGPLLEKAVLLGVPAAALTAVLAASFVLTTSKTRPPGVVFEGKLAPSGAATPKPESGGTAGAGAVTRVGDTTPPKITATTPSPNTNVDTDFTDVIITFNEN
ncbi:MAG: hypothetical protein KDA41_00010, partial [Planctomycetales bacterium]|nr:hypothetical protein [Planctomycetales bacterium]